MRIILETVGLKENIMFNSGLRDYNSSINKRQQYYEIYGNSDKKIILEDIYDLFVDIDDTIEKENIFGDNIVQLDSITDDYMSNKYNSKYAIYWKKC